ncbi:copper/zinc superoxide dismutase [Puccinia triticina 1-1 BBBD Race 1]|uniref:Copper/zinc superoxide dismutase n=1 Tax=Puccinia triticina (isolate 1-1 / race 1 (BBBD)) TaxID=630390 RepID=A0A0C4ELM5_PUCT1|nr:copper/zinc superoxide dismutase [Puccinia triticina 1-1 BBBD Race 1]
MKKENRPADASKFKADRALTSVAVKYSGLEAGKEFTYIIHEKAIQGNNCDTAGDHFDPRNVNPANAPDFVCDRHKQVSHCEAGDLSGKHDKLKGNGATETVLPVYYDGNLRMSYSIHGILGKSLVIKDADGKTVGCGKPFNNLIRSHISCKSCANDAMILIVSLRIQIGNIVDPAPAT